VNELGGCLDRLFSPLSAQELAWYEEADEKPIVPTAANWQNSQTAIGGPRMRRTRVMNGSR
jgi:hypothetical protein